MPLAGDAITGAAGATVSMEMFLLAPSECADPGVANVKVAGLPAASFIDPLPTDKLVVLT